MTAMAVYHGFNGFAFFFFFLYTFGYFVLLLFCFSSTGGAERRTRIAFKVFRWITGDGCFLE